MNFDIQTKNNDQFSCYIEIEKLLLNLKTFHRYNTQDADRYIINYYKK